MLNSYFFLYVWVYHVFVCVIVLFVIFYFFIIFFCLCFACVLVPVPLYVCMCPGWCDHRLRVASPQRGENAPRDKPTALQRLSLQAPQIP